MQVCVSHDFTLTTFPPLRQIVRKGSTVCKEVSVEEDGKQNSANQKGDDEADHKLNQIG